MPRPSLGHSLLRLLACAGCAVVACVIAAPARAVTVESYGELARFGGPGVKNGSFEIKPWTNAFGVDPQDGGVYVGDEPGEEVKNAKYPSGVFRIQKLGATGEFLGAATFKAKCRQGQGAACTNEEKVDEENVGIQGIAFDTVESERRFYVLGTYERAGTLKNNPETVAAAVIYAFSTTPKEEAGEKKLLPAAGTGAEGVLATPETLKTEAKNAGEALLNPRGITVDPTTHEIIVAGEVDLGEGPANSDGQHLALQRVTSNGTLGERYVDPTREFGAVEPNSPVVTQTGQVFVETGSSTLSNEKILQIPSNFKSTSAPTTVYELDNSEAIIEFGEQFSTQPHGTNLAVAPEGEREGMLYANASIAPNPKLTGNEGVLALHYESKPGEEEAHVAEYGWTAGSPQTAPKCEIGFEGLPEEPLVAGDGKKTFVLEPGMNAETPEPRVVEFGPTTHPEGCPEAKATEPQVTIEHTKVTEVALGEEATISSTVEGANALSVEWSFGDGTTKTVSTDENEEAKVTHTFTKTGTLEIVGTIRSDDLATPTLTVKTKIVVVGAGGGPPKLTKNPSSVTIVEGEKAAFAAAATGFSSVQWEEMTTSVGAEWHAVSGATNETLELLSVKAAESGDKYRAVFENAAHEVTPTTAATLTVESKKVHEEKLAKEAKESEEAATKKHEEEAAATKKHQEEEAATKKHQEEEAAALKKRQEEEAAAAKKKQEEAGKGGVQGFTDGTPDATIAGSSLQVSTAGAVTIKVSCPAAAKGCTGSVTLRTLTAVVAASGRTAKTKASILTLASGSFTVSGGAIKAVTLHLSAKARVLLARSHVLRVRATIVARNPQGTAHTDLAIVTLRPAKKKSKH